MFFLEYFQKVFPKNMIFYYNSPHSKNIDGVNKKLRTPKQEEFYNHLRQANHLESKNPVLCLDHLRECYKLMKYDQLNLPNEAYFMEKIQARVNYLIEKLGDNAYQTTEVADTKTPLESLEKKAAITPSSEDQITVDTSEMDQKLLELEDAYEKKIAEIDNDSTLTEKQKKRKRAQALKVKKQQELDLLTAQAIQDQANRTFETPDSSSTEDSEFQSSSGSLSHSSSLNSKISDSEPSAGAPSDSLQEGDALEQSPSSLPVESSETENPSPDNDGEPGTKPRLLSLEPTEIEKIWEFYFLHAYNHPAPTEFYGNGDSKLIIMQMFQEIGDIYDKLDITHVYKEQLPGDSRMFFVGDLNGSFEATDKLMRYFQPKIFESQATENPLRLVFLGNYIGGGQMDFHNLLYLICFNILFPKEVLLFRGTHEDSTKSKKLKLDKYILTHFDQEVLDTVHEFFEKLPVVYYVESGYKLLMATHGFFPLNLEDPEKEINLHELTFNNRTNAIKDMDSYTQQVISNTPAMRMKKDSPYSPISGTEGFKINQMYFDPFVKANNVELMIVGNHTLKNGYRVYYNNQLVGLFSALEYKQKPIKGKILEIQFPSDPEYYDEEYPEADEEEEDEDEEEENDEEGEEFDEELDEAEEEDDEGDEEDEDEEDNGSDSSSLFGVDEKEVAITLLNVEDL